MALPAKSILTLALLALLVGPALGQERPLFLPPPPREVKLPPEPIPPIPPITPITPITPMAPLPVQPPFQPPIQPSCPSCVPVRPFQDRTIHVVEEQNLEMVPQVAVHETLTRIPGMDVEVTYREEKRLATVLVTRPREVEQVVTSFTLMPQTIHDPCTKTSRVEQVSVPCQKIVKVQILEQVPETREFVIRFPVIRPVEKEIQVKQLAIDTTPQPAVVRTLRVLDIPLEANLPQPRCPVPGAPASTSPSPNLEKPEYPSTREKSGKDP